MKTYPLTQLWDRMQSAAKEEEWEGGENERKIYAMWAGHQVVSQPESFTLTCQHSHLRGAQENATKGKRTTSRHEGYGMRKA